MEKTNKKKGKLQVEIDIITVLIFAVILIFSSCSYYHETKDTYLRSKYEMFDRDLENISTVISRELIGTSWFWSYTREHAQDMTRALTEEEEAFSREEETREALRAFLEAERNDFETCGPKLQFLLARTGFQMLAADTDYLVRKFHYADISLMEFLNDREAYLYIVCNTDEPDALAAENTKEFYASSYAACFTKGEYDASRHTAVKSILAEGLAPGKTAYEVWTDPKDGRNYCIGYIPVDYDGKTSCYARVRYDWTDFLHELNRTITQTVLWGLAILAVLNGILLLFIHKRATRPIAKVKDSIQAYMEDKDSARVCKEMNSIRCRNEIGVLADSFAALSTEIDRYTGEILQLGKEKERIATELELANSIQAGALPNKFPAFPERTEFDLYASMDPAKEVGGDFYDFFMTDDDHLALVIADVSGKGVPAALFMMSSKILLNDHAMMGGTPAEILERVNRQVCANNKAHMFVTVWLGILEISTGRLTTASAGHEFPMVNLGGQYELLRDKHGLPIGASRKAKYTNTEIMLKKGDSIFVYTDGVAEATDAQNQLFGTDRTLEALNTMPAGASPKEVLAGIRKAVDAFVREAPQFDDLTMLSLKYEGAEAEAGKQVRE
ncbi:MAG: PP2C family protein-serine/threonine phosphatase [Clostridia bacterium]|nr:PP2C family protein-serine/threonine phosphatase [Clostridia bacterium]